MFTIEPKTINLWTIYQENGTIVSGETDLTVYAIDENEVEILSSTALTEDGSTGLYYYNWDASARPLGTVAKVIYKKGSEILFSDEYYFDDLDDSDSMAM